MNTVAGLGRGRPRTFKNTYIMAERLTIIDFVEKYVAMYSKNPYLWEKNLDTNIWESTTYEETLKKAKRIAAGLMALGVQKGEKVSYLSEGRDLWVIGELGVLYAGAVNVPLSIKLNESELLFRIKHSDSKYVITSKFQLPKLRSILGECPMVEKVIVFDEIEDKRENEMFLNEILELGDEFLAKNEEIFIQRYKSIGPDDYANISYTSGTTADPKGILLTHRNYTANVEQAHSVIGVTPEDRMLIIIPLDHCFAHVAGMYTMMSYGASFGTVPSGKSGKDALRNISPSIKELQPNVMLSVPTLAKNFKKNIEATIKKSGPTVEKLYNFALKNAIAYNKEGYNKGTEFVDIFRKPLMAIFDKIIFKKVREGLGGKMKFFVGGGALLDIDLQRYYYAIGIPMYQGYGLSEATPIICANAPAKHILGSSGKVVTPLEIKILDADGVEQPFGVKGEICIKGENVMAGYWKNPKSTADTIVDGWLHTGDMGYMRDAEMLYVVGRFKSLLIASDGEKYSPEGIEENIVESSKYIDGAIMHNSQDPYTIILLTPNKEALKSSVKELGLDPASKEGKVKMLEILQKEVNMYRPGERNAGLFPERWLPAAVCVLPEPWTEQNHFLNSSMKVVRGRVEEAYKDRMAYAYTPEGKNIVNEMNLSSL